jgi:hypothetical protein
LEKQRKAGVRGRFWTKKLVEEGYYLSGTGGGAGFEVV